MSEIEIIKAMIARWKSEYTQVKEQLIIKGGEANTVEYNILATEALVLSCCMLDATDALLEIVEAKPRSEVGRGA
jgi:hypothetical protein